MVGNNRAYPISYHRTPLTLHLNLRHLRIPILNLIPSPLLTPDPIPIPIPIPIRLPQLPPKPTHLLPPQG